jgi:hypothetical protein
MPRSDQDLIITEALSALDDALLTVVKRAFIEIAKGTREHAELERLMQEFANTSIVIEAINEAKEQLLIERYSGAGTIH